MGAPELTGHVAVINTARIEDPGRVGTAIANTGTIRGFGAVRSGLLTNKGRVLR